ncbi:MAG: ribosomal protein S18-alanine N-acetyltransferase [Pseudomonadota bacterium]
MSPCDMAAIHAAAFTRQRPWAEAEFTALLDDSDVTVCAVEHGFGLVRTIPPDAEILTLAVAPVAQRRGIGSQLVSAMADAATQAGCRRLILEVAASNTAACALYARTGFSQIGRRKAYYRYPDGGTDDALVLARALHASWVAGLPSA